MASATPFGGMNQNTFGRFPRYLEGYGPSPAFMGGLAGHGGPPQVGPVQGAGAGALPGTYNPASGGIPRTPTPGQSMANLLAGISGNLQALTPIISGITSAENQALRDQYPSSYFDTLNTLMGNVANRARGDITDLLPQLGQIGAEWGIGRGVAGGPAAASKLARDVLGSAYAVQQQALQDQGTIQNLIPKVAPYDASRLLPTFPEQISWEDLANVRGAAPIPESAYARARADALAGLNRGFNAGGGGYNWFNPMARPNLGAVGPAAPAAAAVSPWYTPRGGGGVYLPPERGMPANIGGLPGAEAGTEDLGPVYGAPYFDTQPNLWDTPFDMPQDLGQEFG